MSQPEIVDASEYAHSAFRQFMTGARLKAVCAELGVEPTTAAFEALGALAADAFSEGATFGSVECSLRWIARLDAEDRADGTIA